MKTLASIAFALRCNNSESEDLEMLPIIAPYGYDNLPHPVSVATRDSLRVMGRNPSPDEPRTYTERIETFSDGSTLCSAL